MPSTFTEQGRVKKFKPGKLKRAEGMEATVTLELTYILVEVDGTVMLEIDKLNQLYRSGQRAFQRVGVKLDHVLNVLRRDKRGDVLVEGDLAVDKVRDRVLVRVKGDLIPGADAACDKAVATDVTSANCYAVWPYAKVGDVIYSGSTLAGALTSYTDAQHQPC